MRYFIVSGAPSTGKTTTLNAICGWLLDRGYVGEDVGSDDKKYVPITSCLVQNVGDFSYMLHKGDLGILVHSATDDEENINILDTLIREYKPDIVITSCRDYLDSPRQYLCQTLGFTNDYVLDRKNEHVREFPLAKITRRRNWSEPYIWYFNTTTDIIKTMLMAAPYNL